MAARGAENDDDRMSDATLELRALESPGALEPLAGTGHDAAGSYEPLQLSAALRATPLALWSRPSSNPSSERTLGPNTGNA